MPPLHLRQEFPSLKAFKDALHAWAIEAHFEPRILKSDTGRVRVGCKRDASCPFVIRCNWERKQGVLPLARITVLRDRHTCLDGLEWLGALPSGGSGIQGLGGAGLAAGEVGAVRVVDGTALVNLPVLPKVQRNSASRLPFLMEILPRLMNVSKETAPVEIRECLLREYGAEVHLQQCRRAKTEILKRMEGGEEQNSNQPMQGGQEMRGQQGSGQGNAQGMRGQHSQQQRMEAMAEAEGQMFGEMNRSANHSPFTMNSASLAATPPAPARPTSTPQTQPQTHGEPPVRCPYCINQRWMKSIKDAVDHMSMHVVV